MGLALELDVNFLIVGNESNGSAWLLRSENGHNESRPPTRKFITVRVNSRRWYQIKAISANANSAQYSSLRSNHYQPQCMTPMLSQKAAAKHSQPLNISYIRCRYHVST